jgi:hypothetical protein
MITQMEIASGEILSLINKRKRPISISEIEYRLESDRKLTKMSIGLLVQEGRVHLIKWGKERYLCNC